MASIFQRILQVQAAFTSELLAKRGVVGVAMGYKESGGVRTSEPAVVILVEQKLPDAALTSDDKIPRQIDGIPTDVFESGPLRAFSSPSLRGRFRPVVPAGVSIGHFKVTAGTLGAVVYDKRTGEKFLLSNNHVLANSNEALVGDPILQPAAMDGGQNPADVIAKLERFIPLDYIEGDVRPPQQPKPTPTPGGNGGSQPTPSGCDIVDLLVSLSNLLAGLSGSEKRVEATQRSGGQAQATAQASTKAAAPDTAMTAAAAAAPNNRVDCALARPLDPNMFTGEIKDIGAITGIKPVTIGMRVRKVGRTTGYTEGVVNLMNATVKVGYNTSKGTRTAQFVGQALTTGMSQGGDSGSLVLDASENAAVGLLFAGSNAATIFTPISIVLDTLNVRF